MLQTSFNDMTVLIVEDDETLLESLKQMVRDFGVHSVFTAQDGEDGIARVFLLLKESKGDSLFGVDVIQDGCWRGGQHPWRVLIPLIFVNGLLPLFCLAGVVVRFPVLSASASPVLCGGRKERVIPTCGDKDP